MPMAVASPAMPVAALRGRRSCCDCSVKGRREITRVVGRFGHLGEVVRKDVEFLKKGLKKGMEWANVAFRIPQVKKTVDDALWLRNLEDSSASTLEPQSWPEPHYPDLSGMDLLLSDLKALEAYTGYFQYKAKMWSKPLPEAYDPQAFIEYFDCRPHVVALRLLEVFLSFLIAAIRIRTSGVGWLADSSPDKDISGNPQRYKFGIVLKETMLYLGPTFIKVGQSLSTRPDIIGTEMSKALSGLHDQIPPFPRNVAMKIIEEELGSPAESFFSYISEEPVAAASFGQVYHGRTHDGSLVAVKVQRPDMRHVVARDIYILRLGLGLVQKIAKRKNDLRLYADELGKGLVGELDYTLEASNTTKFLEAHSRFTFMRIPKVFDHLSRKRVLTLEWVVGESPTELISLLSNNINNDGSVYSDRQHIDVKRRLLDMVNKGVEATLIQLLETGLLHADPHPGNLRYTPSGQLGFLDFGLLCQMEKKHQYAMLASIVHIVNGDWASLVQALIEMDVVRPGTNIWRVTMDLEYALGEVEFNEGIPDVKFSKVLGKVWSVALKYHFRMPPYYTLVLRSLASFEGLAVAVDQNFKTFEAAYPYVVRKLLTENSAPMRKILHSVVLNRKREFRWNRLALFLRVSSTSRKNVTQMISSNNEANLDIIPNKSSGLPGTISWFTRLLTSKDGVVLRRLIMTADGASLVRAMVSKEARILRQQLCMFIADILCQWMYAALGQSSAVPRYSYQLRVATESGNREMGPSSKLSAPTYNYQSIIKDRRLKVILSKVLGSARRDPVLMLRLCWTSFVMFMTASALACHKVIISLSETYLGAASYSPKRRYAVSV